MRLRSCIAMFLMIVFAGSKLPATAQMVKLCGDDLISGGYNEAERLKNKLWIEGLCDKVKSPSFCHLIEPELMRRIEQSGDECWFYCDLSKTGDLSGFKFEHSSGSETLDSKLVDAFKSGNPYTKPPTDVNYKLIIAFKVLKHGRLDLFPRLDKFLANPELMRNP